MKTVIVIPARYGSSRFPGKPMAKVAGLSLLERVWRIASAVKGVDGVFVATDDQRIASHVSDFGGRVVITSESCRNGSERVHEAVQALGISPRVVINFQGDAVLMPPWIIGALVEEMNRDQTVQIATPAVRLSSEQYSRMVAMKDSGIVSGTTVTFSTKRDALYFSKGIIPFIRSLPEGKEPPVFQHIGVYAYTAESLARYISLPMGVFEEVEQLEQLRALEHGIPIRVVEVSLQGRTTWSIDNPQDVLRAEEIIRAEGELVADPKSLSAGVGSQAHLAKNHPEGRGFSSLVGMSPCLILCRHGNTFSKGEKVVMIGAREDLPLTEEGITQAQAIGRALNSAQVRLSRVVSGPLQRTTVFADRVVSELEGRLPIEIDPRLTELDYGAWSGLSDVEIKERFGEVAFTRWQELSERPSMVEFAPPAAQVEAEISSLLSEFSAQEGISLVVTSNGRLREFGRLALDQKAVRSKGFKMKTGNASLLQFHDGAWRVIAWDLQPEGLVEVLASLSP